LAFRVIQGGNRKNVYDFLLVIDSNLRPISHRFLKFFHPSFGVTVFEFMEMLYASWN